MFISSKRFYYSSSIIIVLIILLLCSCSTSRNAAKESTSFPIPTYVLTPGERLETLWGNHNDDLGSLEIYVDNTISQEKYIDENGDSKERDTIPLRILYPELGEYKIQTFSVHKGQVIMFGEYRLRVLEIRKSSSGQTSIVEVAILEP